MDAAATCAAQLLHEALADSPEDQEAATLWMTAGSRLQTVIGAHGQGGVNYNCQRVLSADQGQSHVQMLSGTAASVQSSAGQKQAAM